MRSAPSIGRATARLLTCTVLACAFWVSQTAPARAARPETLGSLRHALAVQQRAAGHHSGAEVLDLTTGRVLYAAAATAPRLPASVEKIYTTSTALLRFGPDATFATQLLGVGSLDSAGTWAGTLYLRGGGDPTFGSDAFDAANYGAGATVEQLVSNLLATVPMQTFTGNVVGDESWFDSLRGTPPYRFRAASDISGQLSALAYDRGFVNANWTGFQPKPPVFAAQQLVKALRAAGVSVRHGIQASAGVTPVNAGLLASVQSPTLTTLLALTNAPSDNFFAETLLKDLGAAYGGAGSSAAGASVVTAEVASEFGIHPQLEDGSGLSRRDRTSPSDVVRDLTGMAGDGAFVSSLAVAGRSGTLVHRMRGTAAAGRCEAKTGTLHDVSNLAGYCQAVDGHTLAFAFLMNSVNPDSAHSVQDAMAVALAQYAG